MPRLRRAHALLLAWHDSMLIGLHYPSRRTAVVDAVDQHALARAATWIEPASLLASLALRVGSTAAEAAVRKLTASHLLLAEGSEEERRDALLRDQWPWGHEAALYQLSIHDVEYLEPAAAAERFRQRSDRQQPIDLLLGNDDGEKIALPPVDLGECPLFSVLRRRRSRRSFAVAAPLRSERLATVLAAGLAITDFAIRRTPGPGPSRLPLKMTPSGGARNPYEGYVAVRHVDGLAAGAYHYAGEDHTLGRLEGRPPALSQLLGGQEWFDRAAAVIFLVADFRRTAWKYPHPTAYRVVLLEAGHIAQNMLLAAADLQLAAAPSAAIHDTAVEALFGLDGPLQAAIYAVAVGEPGEQPSQADFEAITPNPNFP